jgi:hypothetical protein
MCLGAGRSDTMQTWSDSVLIHYFFDGTGVVVVLDGNDVVGVLGAVVGPLAFPTGYGLDIIRTTKNPIARRTATMAIHFVTEVVLVRSACL